MCKRLDRLNETQCTTSTTQINIHHGHLTCKLFLSDQHLLSPFCNEETLTLMAHLYDWSLKHFCVWFNDTVWNIHTLTSILDYKACSLITNWIKEEFSWLHFYRTTCLLIYRLTRFWLTLIVLFILWYFKMFKSANPHSTNLLSGRIAHLVRAVDCQYEVVSSTPQSDPTTCAKTKS